MVYKRSKQRQEVDYGQQLRQQRVDGSVSRYLPFSPLQKLYICRSTPTSLASSPSPWPSSSPSLSSTSSLSAKVILRWNFRKYTPKETHMTIKYFRHKTEQSALYWVLFKISNWIQPFCWKGDPGSSEEMLGGAFVAIFCTYFHTVSFTLNLPLR